MTGQRLGAAHRRRTLPTSEDPFKSTYFREISRFRRGGMGINVINLFRRNAGRFKRVLNGRFETGSVRMRTSRVETVRCLPPPREFTVYRHPAFTRCVCGFKDQGGRPTGTDKAVAIAVKRTGCPLRHRFRRERPEAAPSRGP